MWRNPISVEGKLANADCGSVRYLVSLWSFMLTEVAGQKSRTSWLSVVLAGPDLSVFGGSVAGLLIAASPAQDLSFPKVSTRKGKLMKSVQNGVVLSKILLIDDDGKFVGLE